MPVREIAGPNGRLEALLDEPADTRGGDARGRVHTGLPGGLRARRWIQ